MVPIACEAFEGMAVFKLDGVGPVDNRPSNKKLHVCVKEKIIYYNMWNVTHDMGYMTCDTWHDMLGVGEHCLKMSSPYV